MNSNHRNEWDTLLIKDCASIITTEIAQSTLIVETFYLVAKHSGHGPTRPLRAKTYICLYTYFEGLCED